MKVNELYGIRPFTSVEIDVLSEQVLEPPYLSRIIHNLYGELEDTLLLILSAGVPASCIQVDREPTFERSGTSFNVVLKWRFIRRAN